MLCQPADSGFVFLLLLYLDYYDILASILWFLDEFLKILLLSAFGMNCVGKLQVIWNLFHLYII